MKTRTGKVVSTKMKNTVVVEVAQQRLHPLYKKFVKRTKRYKVDYPGSSFKVGDTVQIAEIRPLSKEKHYKVIEKKSTS
ncbi:30S ribosomal protein S17 [Candidatus Gottesmanbacteria bacterium]|nr:30S ribosomal protein S17 [Candidatus Gottesmanbacteria bacterium]